MVPEPITLNVIGCGRAARSLLRVWVAKNLVRVVGIVNRSVDSASEAVAFLGQGTPVGHWSALPPAQALLVGVPDQEISRLVDEWAKGAWVPAQDFVFHLSGALTSDVFAPLQSAGIKSASLHPMMTFADPAQAAAYLSRCVYTVEGDEEICQLLARVVEESGGKAVRIIPAQKPYYHSALVFICNYLVVLFHIGTELLIRSGFDTKEAQRAIRPLVEATVANCFRLGVAESLTGPVARGDADVIRGELAALSEANPRWAAIYRLLAEEAFHMILPRGVLDPAKIDTLKELLS